MKDESFGAFEQVLLHLSAFILYASRVWRRSQVVRQRSAKPLFIGSIPIAASNKIKSLRAEI
jgi:hypothetical protein